jgi:hypothetical protein
VERPQWRVRSPAYAPTISRKPEGAAVAPRAWRGAQHLDVCCLGHPGGKSGEQRQIGGERRPTPTAGPNAVTPARSRGLPRATSATAAIGKHSSPSLADQVLALATGNTQQEIAAACKGARPNHVGAAISRHKRAGRIEERDGKLYGTQSTETEQRAML